MANSDNRANYARIGFTLVAGAIAAAAALMYLGGTDSRKARLMAETYCQGGVSGLSTGSDVTFRGVKVGEVKEITFVGREYDVAREEDGRKILIRLALDEAKIKTRHDLAGEDSLRRYVEHGLRATVTSSGITGLSHIELNYHKDTAPADEDAPSWQSSCVTIPPAPSILDSFSDAASRVMRQLDGMDFTAAWSNVNSFVASAASLAGSANEIIESERAKLSSLMDDAESTLSGLKELVDELKENPSLLIRARDPEPLEETAD